MFDYVPSMQRFTRTKRTWFLRFSKLPQSSPGLNAYRWSTPSDHRLLWSPIWFEATRECHRILNRWSRLFGFNRARKSIFIELFTEEIHGVYSEKIIQNCIQRDIVKSLSVNSLYIVSRTMFLSRLITRQLWCEMTANLKRHASRPPPEFSNLRIDFERVDCVISKRL